MLVGGGVEHDLGAMAFEQGAQLDLVADVQQAGREVGEVPFGLELVLDLEEVALGVVDQNEPPWAHGGQLPAELAADRTAGAGHHDDLAGDVADAVVVDRHLVPAEDVFDLHLAELADGHRALDELEDAGQGLHRHVGLLAGHGDVLDQPAAHRRHGDDDLVDRVLRDQGRQVARGAHHAHAVDAQVLLFVVVVDEADRSVADLARLLHLAHDELSGVAGADDEHLLAVAAALLAPGPLPGDARQHPGAAHEAEAQHPVEGDHRARQEVGGDHIVPVAVDRGLQVVDHELADDHRHGAAGQRAPEEAGQVAHAHIAPPLVVHAQQHEHGELHDDDRHDDLEKLVTEGPGDVEVEPQGIGADQGDRDERGVGDDLPESVAADEEALSQGVSRFR